MSVLSSSLSAFDETGTACEGLRKRGGPRGTSWQLLVHVVDPTTGRRRQLARTVHVATRREAERELRAFVTEVEDGAVRAERPA